jgi:carbonic anhydrase
MMRSNPNWHDRERAAQGAVPCCVDRRTVLRRALAVAPAAMLLGVAARAQDSDSVPPAPPTPQNPRQALEALRAGNERFDERRPLVRSAAEIERIWTTITASQSPFASILGCADSRLSPEIIFDQFLGDLFVVREAGNIAGGPTSLGSLEYAQAVLGSKLVLVVGHSSCGAVKAAFGNAPVPGNIQAIVDAIRPGIAGATTLDQAITLNVRATIANVRSSSALLRQAEAAGTIAIRGAVYNLEDGRVTFLEN